MINRIKFIHHEVLPLSLTSFLGSSPDRFLFSWCILLSLPTTPLISFNSPCLFFNHAYATSESTSLGSGWKNIGDRRWEMSNALKSAFHVDRNSSPDLSSTRTRSSVPTGLVVSQDFKEWWSRVRTCGPCFLSHWKR